MLFTKKKESELLRKLYAREESMFEAIMDEVDLVVNTAKNDLMDLIFTLSSAVKVTPKKFAENYQLEKLKKFAEDLSTEVKNRIIEERKKAREAFEKSIKNVYDKPKTPVKKVVKVAKKK